MDKPERVITAFPKGAGNKECVALAQATLQMPLTKYWRAGDKVFGHPGPKYYKGIEIVGSGLAKGTVIATFVKGKYPNLSHGNHVAIYIGQGKNYIKVIDQWRGQTPHYRNIYQKKGMSNRSNNANAFSVVLTQLAPPHGHK